MNSDRELVVERVDGGYGEKAVIRTHPEYSSWYALQIRDAGGNEIITLRREDLRAALRAL